MSTRKISPTLLLKFFVLYHSSLCYITRENWENGKLCENTPPAGSRVSTQFLVFPISTCVDITVYQHGKCFIFLNLKPGHETAHVTSIVKVDMQ